MDGAGKSTAALELAARLEARGRTAFVSWARLAADSEILDLIAAPVRRLLRRRGQIADPAAAGAPVSEETEPAGSDAVDRGRRGPVEWTWVVIVAAINARSCRRSARLRRDGLVVICDRWLPDALVDLELRYGRHRAAEWVLRKGVPAPDLSVVLDIDAATAEQRKPGDQPASVLARMAGAYERVTRELGFKGGAAAGNGRVLIDARGDQATVVAELEERIAQRLD
jgi:thymidylate kinase